jgi:DNA (cytosine-5)-methyltransferase 1
MNSVGQFRALDLFAGAGGLGLGLTHAGFHVVAANEYEQVFSESYAINHPETRVICGDILNNNIRRELYRAAKGVDLVAGGPPCQGFSTVGSKNESDPRNRLFSAFLEVVDELNPRAVLFENVSGFRRMYSSRAFVALCSGLSKLKYSVTDENCRLLNAVHFGVPQHRLRTFVVAFRDGQGFRFPDPSYSVETDLFSRQRALTLQDALSDLPIVAMGESASGYARPPQNEYQRIMRSGVAMDSLTEQDGPNHGPKLMEMIQHVPVGGTVADIPEHLRPRSYFANTYSRLWWDKPSTTITRNLGTPSSSRCIHPLADRGLTTREAARLQGFPDAYRFVGSRSEKNLQIGNAVPPTLGAVVGTAIANSLSHRRATNSQVAQAVCATA